MRQSVLFASVLALASSVVAGPVHRRSPARKARQQGVPLFAGGSGSHSFDGFGGLSSLSDFDSFWGSDNFCGSENSLVIGSESVVCESVSVTVVQQQLTVLTELAKKIVITQICEPEAQTIVWSQYLGMLESFSLDIRHESSRSVTFDSSIASLIGNVCNSEGVLSSSDLGFDGSVVGQNCVDVSGIPWDSDSSLSVGSAFSACQSAITSSLNIPGMCESTCLMAPPIISSCPSISDCSGSDCSLPSMSCGDDCSIISMPPSCDGSDCPSLSLPPCNGTDCSDPSLSLPPTCDGSSDCSSPPTETDSAGDALPTDSADDALPTDSAGDALPTDSADDALPTDSAGDVDSAGDSLPTDSAGDPVDVGASPTDAAVAPLPTDDSVATPADTADAAAATASGTGGIGVQGV